VKLKLLFLASVVVAMTLALLGAMQDIGTIRAAAPLPVQPYNPQSLGGQSTTQLGQKVGNLGSYSQNPNGHRSGGGTGFTGPGYYLDLDKDVATGVAIGDVSASLDVNCDGGLDGLYDNCISSTPLDFLEEPTAVVGTADSWLIPIMPPYPWFIRQEANFTHLCLGTSGAQVGVISVLNTISSAVPFSPGGGTFSTFTMLGGQPGGAPSPICTDGPSGSIAHLTTLYNPKLQGDIDGPCDTGTNECADATVSGMWTNNTVSIASAGSTTITVQKRLVNSGPEDGTFKELWEVESTNANITAEWVAAGAPVYSSTVSLEDGVGSAQSTDLSISCSTSGDYWGLVVLKNILAPILPTEDTYLDDNASLFTVLVKCGNPATTPEVDKAAAVIRSVGADHLAINTSDTAPIALDILTVNNSAASVLGDEWLVAESADTDATPGPDLTLAWVPSVTINDGSAGTNPDLNPTVTSCGTGCIKFQANEWKGQADVLATLNVTCPATTPTGLYPLVVKAIDAPAAGAGFEFKPVDNAQYKVFTVRCGGAAPDGKEDGNGLYTTWSTNSSDPDLRKPLKSPPSIASDTRYIERTVTPACYWLDSNGCSLATCDTDSNGVISASESWNDPDLVALGGIDAVDPDRDCLIDPAFAQPGHPADSVPDLSGSLCPTLQYTEDPIVTRYDTATDSDCDGLTDGIERAWGSNPLLTDSDADGSNDFIEIFSATIPVNPDTDNDGFKDARAGAYGNNTDPNVDNCPTVYNPDQINSDGQRRDNGPKVPGTWASNPIQDKNGDACDLDNDNDNALDIYEDEIGTNPLKLDTDGDTVNDGAEARRKNAADLNADPLDPAKKPAWSNTEQVYYRGCHIAVPTSGPYGVPTGVEMDPDGDGILCPSDSDSDSGAPTHANKPEVLDKYEAYGYNSLISVADTDGDGCEDWVEIHDLNGDRTVDSGDVGTMNKRIAGKITSDPVSDVIFDVNKDGFIDAGEMNKNTCLLKPWGGCPLCPSEN
jgi:hypothetical protein